MAQAYLSWTGHGSSCGQPPGIFTGGKMHLFGIDVDHNAVQSRLVDSLLNAVPGSPVHYTCFLDMAMVSFMDIKKCTMNTEVIGWVPGRECAIWIPLLETQVTNPVQTRVVLWAPYIFINYAIGLVTGREVWGWSKALGEIKMPAGPNSSPSFVLSTLLFKTFSASTPGLDGPLLSATGTVPISTTSIWPDIDTAINNVIAKLSNLPVGGGSPFGSPAEVPIVALKQFRDSQSPQFACFQAIVNSPVKVTGFNAGGLHPGTFKLRITTCDSHKIVLDLKGVPPSTGSTVVPVKFAAWIAFDFDALTGSEVYRST